MIEWHIEGISFGNCNCAYGCPCQFEALPTHGDCRGMEVATIDRGHFGDDDLSGLHLAILYAWPGAIFEGKGELQVVIDERADERRRAALDAILHGRETEDAATHWWVYSAMCDTVHETLYRPIELALDIDARTARASIPGVIEASGRPIRPPHGDGDHRVRIDIPDGIEFELAEIGSASTNTGDDAAIGLRLDDSYGQFNVLRHSGSGVVHA